MVRETLSGLETKIGLFPRVLPWAKLANAFGVMKNEGTACRAPTKTYRRPYK